MQLKLKGPVCRIYRDLLAAKKIEMRVFGFIPLALYLRTMWAK